MNESVREHILRVLGDILKEPYDEMTAYKSYFLNWLHRQGVDTSAENIEELENGIRVIKPPDGISDIRLVFEPENDTVHCYVSYEQPAESIEFSLDYDPMYLENISNKERGDGA